MSEQYFVRSSGKVLGPFTWAQLQDLRKRGRLHEFHELSSDRISWLPAGSLPELFPPQPQGASAPQPTTAAGEGQWFYADLTGERRGPVARHQLEEFVTAGSVTQDSLVWTKGMADWRPAGDAVPEMFQTAPRLRSPLTPRTGRWGPARVGLLLTAIAALVFAGTIIFSTVATVLVLLDANAEHSAEGLRQGLGIIRWVVIGLYVVVVVLEIVGFGLCAAAPRSSGTRGVANTALVLAIGHLVAYGVYALFADIRGGVGNNPDADAARIGAILLLLLLAVSGLLALTYRFFFLLFLRGVALACEARGTAVQVTILTIIYGALIFLFVIVALLGFLGRENEAVIVVAGIGSLLLVVLGLGWLVWYIVVQFLVRAATGRRG